MTDCGKYRHILTAQRFVGTRDVYGEPLTADDTAWENFLSFRAAISPISGREFYAAEQLQSEVTHKVRCRYRDGLHTEHRLKFGRRTFQILSVIDWEERHESLLIMCKELVE